MSNIKTKAELVELYDSLEKDYLSFISGNSEVTDAEKEEFIIKNCKPIGDLFVYPQLREEWEDYCHYWDVYSYIDTVCAMAGISGGISLEEIKKFLQSRGSGDVFQGFYEAGVLCYFMQKGPEFYKLFFKGSTSESTIHLNSYPDHKLKVSKITLGEIEKRNENFQMQSEQ